MKNKSEKEKHDNKTRYDIEHIRLIICNNEREKAAGFIVANGYAASMKEAIGIIDREDGKR